MAATITKLQGSKQVEYDRAQAAAQAAAQSEAKREYSVADLPAVVVADVLVGLMLVLIMPVD